MTEPVAVSSVASQPAAPELAVEATPDTAATPAAQPETIKDSVEKVVSDAEQVGKDVIEVMRVLGVESYHHAEEILALVLKVKQ